MFIDDKGRLFGKLNLLDLIIVLIIIAVLAFGGWYFARGGAGSAETLTVDYTVEVLQKDPEYFDYIIEGEKVVDGVTKQPVGEIVSFETQTSRYLTQNNETLSLGYEEIEGKLDGHIVIRLDAEVAYPDLKSGDEKIKIGKQVAYRSESAAIKGYIIGMDYDNEKLEEMK